MLGCSTNPRTLLTARLNARCSPVRAACPRTRRWHRFAATTRASSAATRALLRHPLSAYTASASSAASRSTWACSEGIASESLSAAVSYTKSVTTPLRPAATWVRYPKYPRPRFGRPGRAPVGGLRPLVPPAAPRGLDDRRVDQHALADDQPLGPQQFQRLVEQVGPVPVFEQPPAQRADRAVVGVASSKLSPTNRRMLIRPLSIFSAIGSEKTNHRSSRVILSRVTRGQCGRPAADGSRAGTHRRPTRPDRPPGIGYCRMAGFCLRLNFVPSCVIIVEADASHRRPHALARQALILPQPLQPEHAPARRSLAVVQAAARTCPLERSTR